MKRKDKICTLGLSHESNPTADALVSNLRQRRLARGFACLEYLQRERENAQDRYLAKILEGRIIWRELLDLELQDIDEQIERVCASAAGPDRGARGNA